MANIKQQKKRVRIAERQRAENLRYRSTVKTLTKRLEAAVADGRRSDKVAAEHLELVRTIDKAASRGALHKNTAARKKARAARSSPATPLLALGADVDQRALELEIRRSLLPPFSAWSSSDMRTTAVRSSSSVKFSAWPNTFST